MRFFSDMRFLVATGLIFSIIIFIAPFVNRSLREGLAQKIERNFKSVEFALNLFFYTEGFEIMNPSSVGIKTLVERYYLRRSPGEFYKIVWLDSNVYDDNRILAVVYYSKKVDPVILEREYPRVKWFDPKRKSLLEDYDENRFAAIEVEVNKTW